jgi:CHAD domain-containing protein
MTTDRRNGRGAAVVPDVPRPDTTDAVDRLATEAMASPASKADRADRAPRARPSLGPRPEPIAATDVLAAAGRKIMWVHLDRLLARESGARDAERPDELRRYRVATRRLRAALRMFAADYPDREVRPLRRGLSDLAGAVGAVRDLDLRIADLNRWAIERGPDAVAAIGPMAAAWGRERERAVASLHRRWGSKRHRRFLTKLVRFVESGSASSPDDPTLGPLTVQDRAASRIWLAYEEVRAFAPAVPSADLETLHRLRIAGKRLRDTLEFLGEVLGPERAWLVERLVALQDHLGTLNDATVAVDAVRAFLEKRGGTLAPEEQLEIAAYLAEKDREVLALKDSVGRPWRLVAGIGFAGRLGRAVVVRGVAA